MGYNSQLGQVGFARQTALGAAATIATAAPTRWMKMISSSVGPDRNLIIPDPEIQGAGGRDVGKPYLGPSAFSGDYNAYVRSEALPLALYGVLGGGGAAPTGSGTAGYTHSITTADTLPLFTIQEQVADGFDTFQYLDSIFNSLHLEVAADGFWQTTLGVMALSQTAGVTAATPAFDNTPKYVGSKVSVTFNSVALPAASWSLDINNQTENNHFVLGSLFADGLTPKRREITGSFSLRPTSNAMFRQAVFGSPTATGISGTVTVQNMTVTATTYEIISGATSQVYSVSIALPEVVLAPFKVEPSQDNTVEHSIDFRATKIAAANSVTATIINGISTAYNA